MYNVSCNATEKGTLEDNLHDNTPEKATLADILSDNTTKVDTYNRHLSLNTETLSDHSEVISKLSSTVEKLSEMFVQGEVNGHSKTATTGIIDHECGETHGMLGGADDINSRELSHLFTEIVRVSCARAVALRVGQHVGQADASPASAKVSC